MLYFDALVLYNMQTIFHMSIICILNVVKGSYGRQSPVANGHLGRAQVADARHVSHIGLGSNFQPSLI